MGEEVEKLERVRVRHVEEEVLQWIAQKPDHHFSFPIRDCWSEEATSTLVDAWGHRFVDLNRGNLRQKDWQEVADVVNLRYGHTKKTRRTNVEKAKVSESNGSVTSSWSFFSRLVYLIGSTTTLAKKPHSPPLAVPLEYRKPPSGLVVQPVVLFQKRLSPVVDDSYFRRNYSTVTIAAMAEKQENEETE
ncbi:hypothetical protein ACSBR1_031110 [Camellia fascicularis]